MIAHVKRFGATMVVLVFVVGVAWLTLLEGGASIDSDGFSGDSALDEPMTGRRGVRFDDSSNGGGNEQRSADGRRLVTPALTGEACRVISSGAAPVPKAMLKIWPHDRAPYETESDVAGNFQLLGSAPWYIHVGHQYYAGRRIVLKDGDLRSLVLEKGGVIDVTVLAPVGFKGGVRIAVVPQLRGFFQDSVFGSRPSWREAYLELVQLLERAERAFDGCLRGDRHSLELRKAWFYPNGDESSRDFGGVPDAQYVYGASPSRWEQVAEGQSKLVWTGLPRKCKYRIGLVTVAAAVIRPIGEQDQRVAEGGEGTKGVLGVLGATHHVPGLSDLIDITREPSWVIRDVARLPSLEITFPSANSVQSDVLIEVLDVRGVDRSNRAFWRESKLRVDSPSVVRLDCRSAGEKRLLITSSDRKGKFWVVRRDVVTSSGQVSKVYVSWPESTGIFVHVKNSGPPRVEESGGREASRTYVLGQLIHHPAAEKGGRESPDPRGFAGLFYLPVDKKVTVFGLGAGVLFLSFPFDRVYIADSSADLPGGGLIVTGEPVRPQGWPFVSKQYKGPIEAWETAECSIGIDKAKRYSVVVEGVASSSAQKARVFLQTKTGYRPVASEAKAMEDGEVRVSFKAEWGASSKALIGFWRNDLTDEYRGLEARSSEGGFAFVGRPNGSEGRTRLQGGRTLVVKRDARRSLPAVLLACPVGVLGEGNQMGGVPIFARFDDSGRAVVTGIPEGVRFKYWFLSSRVLLGGAKKSGTFVVPEGWGERVFSMDPAISIKPRNGRAK